jgi:hypothetical protein
MRRISVKGERKGILKNRLIIALLTVAVLALLTAHFIIGADYLEQRRARESLVNMISETEWALSQIPEPAPRLRDKLAEAEAALVVERSGFPADINSTSFINDILELAEECQVKTIPLVTQPWTADPTGEGYEVFRLNLSVSGEFGHLHTFIGRLEGGDFNSLNVEDLNLRRTGLAEDGETVLVNASIDLAVYCRSAATGEGALR